MIKNLGHIQNQGLHHGAMVEEVVNKHQKQSLPEKSGGEGWLVIFEQQLCQFKPDTAQIHLYVHKQTPALLTG